MPENSVEPSSRVVAPLVDPPLTIGVGSYTVSFAVHTPAAHFYDYRVDNMVIEVLGPLPSVGLAVVPLDLEIERNPTPSTQ